MRTAAIVVLAFSLWGAGYVAAACEDWSTPPWTQTTYTSMNSWYVLEVGPDFILAIGSINSAYDRTPYLVAFEFPPGFPNGFPARLHVLSQLMLPNFAESICINGDFAYLAGNAAELTIVDISDPTAMVIDHTMPLPVASRDLLLDPSRDLLFSAEWNSVRIYSTEQPDDPVLVGSVVSPQSTAMARDGELIYTACASLGLRVIDASDPELPVELALSFAGGTVRDVALWQNRALMVGPTVGLVSIDVTQPAAPMYLDRVPCEGEVESITIAGGHAYLRSLNFLDPEIGFYQNKVHLFRLLAADTPLFCGSFFSRTAGGLNAGVLAVMSDAFLLADSNIMMAVAQCEPVSTVRDVPATALELGQPRPNPFNPAVELAFRLPRDHAGRLSVYDMQGRKVQTLWMGLGDGLVESFVWRGQTCQGSTAPSGTYLFVLQDEENGDRQIKRASLVK